MSDALPEPRDDDDQKLLDDVAQVGWHLVLVPEDADTPGWAYTIGLERSHGHPELVVFGLDLETAGGVLNLLGERIRDGERFALDAEIADVIEDGELALRPVAARWYEPFLGYARWFYGGDGFTAWQLFWPEDDGVMPWDEGASEWLRENQPRLYATRVGEAGVEALLASM
ncbi:MAG: DUF4262 domain-containing protein [Myxococcales bacterium]|nr:DUF4262 domain-containing protein [Myxococcales bacterium]MCB9732943.1 DUF4262 domain-containing protein [Deltaproteobacteria bacterium]